MPQMSPMNWCLFMMIMLMFMSTMFNKNKMFKNMKLNKNLNMMSKKWHW